VPIVADEWILSIFRIMPNEKQSSKEPHATERRGPRLYEPATDSESLASSVEVLPSTLGPRELKHGVLFRDRSAKEHPILSRAGCLEQRDDGGRALRFARELCHVEKEGLRHARNDRLAWILIALVALLVTASLVVRSR